jgi:hypothetical protein
MCFVLYMASDKARREIPWDEKLPAFHVKADDADAQKARRQFSKRYAYYLGSSSGCGCDFRREPDWIHEKRESDEKQKAMTNQSGLHAYVKECLVDEDTLELFGCWSGDEDKPIQNRRNIHVDDLLGNEFFFDDNNPELITVTK